MKLRLALAVAAGLLVACANIEVDVDLKRDGSQHRRLAISGNDESTSDAPTSLLSAPGRVYVSAREVDGKIVRFEGTFDSPPRDLASGKDANRGGTSFVEAPYGSVYLYRESLPGRTDYFAAVEEIGAAIDVFIRVAVRVAQNELEGERGLDKLIARFEGPVRRDLKDLLVLWFSASLRKEIQVAPAPEQATTGVWLALATADLLEERGYLDPKVMRGRLQGSFDPSVILRRVHAEIGKTMGRVDDATLTEKLRVYDDLGRFSEAYARAREDLELSDVPPFPEFFIAPFVRDAGVTLRVGFEGRRPWLTNGSWNGSDRRVEWHGDLTSKQVGRPLFFAIWTVPNEDWQQTHFGGVTLDGAELAKLAQFDAELTSESRADWRSRLETLRPNDDSSIKGVRGFDPIRDLSVGQIRAWATSSNDGPRIVLEALERANANRPKPAK